MCARLGVSQIPSATLCSAGYSEHTQPDDPANTGIQEYSFPWPDENKGYALFPEELENHPLVLFHGTPKRNLSVIRREGFRATQKLQSVSYAKNSISSLTHVIVRRDASPEREDYVVIAVRFKTLDTPEIRINLSDIHVDNPQLQPAIIGNCVVPKEYAHR